MGLVDVPLADFAGFVFVQAEPHAQLRLLQAVAHSEFHRRVEGRVAAQNQQQVHGAGVQVFHQVVERSQLVHRVGLDGSV